MQSYLGLTPGEHSSAERERRTGITKAGPMELRRTLIQAGWAAMCFVRTSHPVIDWARRVAERRGRPVAAVIARDLSDVGALAVACEKHRKNLGRLVPLTLVLPDHLDDADVVPHDLESYDE